MLHKKCIYIALDGVTRRRALWLTKKLMLSRHANFIAGFKIHDLWDRFGETIVKDLRKNGAKAIWLDFKLHDTPKALGERIGALREKDIDLLSVHAGSGVRGLRAAVSSRLNIVAITVLTSLDHREVSKIYHSSPRHTVRRLFALAKQAKVWGVVCSTQELQFLPRHRKIRLLVPGIQIEKSVNTNQKRTGTPHEALSLGADYIVLGSAITKAEDPIMAFEKIAEDLDRHKNRPSH